MNEANPFVISQFTNASVEIVFRVDGRLDGKRIRKNFSTRAEADAERRVLQVQRLQGEAGCPDGDHPPDGRTAPRSRGGVSKPQGDLAIPPRIPGCGIANYRGPQQQKPLCEAVADYLATKHGA